MHIDRYLMLRQGGGREVGSELIDHTAIGTWTYLVIHCPIDIQKQLSNSGQSSFDWWIWIKRLRAKKHIGDDECQIMVDWYRAHASRQKLKIINHHWIPRKHNVFDLFTKSNVFQWQLYFAMTQQITRVKICSKSKTRDWLLWRDVQVASHLIQKRIYEQYLILCDLGEYSRLFILMNHISYIIITTCPGQIGRGRPN